MLCGVIELMQVIYSGAGSVCDRSNTSLFIVTEMKLVYVL